MLLLNASVSQSVVIGPTPAAHLDRLYSWDKLYTPIRVFSQAILLAMSSVDGGYRHVCSCEDIPAGKSRGTMINEAEVMQGLP